jgi:hypothetical protein
VINKHLVKSETYPECNHRNGITLKPEKISEYTTHLVCISCGELIGEWTTDPDEIKAMKEESLREWV